MAITSPSEVALGVQHWGEVTPEKIAVKYGTQRITFAELNRALAAFASRLDGIVDRGKLLPIIASANLNSYLAVASACRAGINFAPIDSSNPAEAIDEIFTQLGRPTHVVVTDPAFLSKVPADCSVIEIDCTGEIAFPPRGVDPSALAAVLFTSGSTGKPKGVCLSWSNLDSIKIDNARINSKFKDIGCISVYNSLGYLFGLWPSISPANGYTIAIQNPISLTADELIREMNEHQVTNVGLVPSLIERICDSRSSTSFCTTIENVVLAGEGTNWEQVEKIRDLMTQEIEIIGLYGASEVSYVMFEYLLPEKLGSGRVPLGLPVNRDRIILDPIEGSSLFEISVTGPIALGYLNDPVLTDSKFSLGVDGARIYKTGDLTLLSEDGVYLHAGRVDDLIKINGRLVDPSEAERHLLEIDGIESAVVLPHKGDDGKFRLVGHVKIAAGSKINPSEVYEILLSKLASNLVPTKLVKHEVIPLNDRGKVDRQLLLTTDWPRWKIESAAVPLSKTEIFVLQTISKILSRPDLELDEDIFGAGFDSIAAIEFIVIASDFGYRNFTPSVFLLFRSSRSIASMLDENRRANFSQTSILNSKGTRQPIFCIPGAGLTALWYREYAESLGEDQPLVIVEPRGMHSGTLSDKSVEAQATSAIQEINRIAPLGPVNIIGHSAGGDVAFEIAQRFSAIGNREVRLAFLDSHKVLEKLRTAHALWKFKRLAKRVRGLFRRTLAENIRAITRRFNAIRFRITSGRGGGSLGRYDHFTLLSGSSAARYLPSEPKFKMLLLYVKGSENPQLWKSIPTLSASQIAGTHINLLEKQYLEKTAELTKNWFGDSSSNC